MLQVCQDMPVLQTLLMRSYKMYKQHSRYEHLIIKLDDETLIPKNDDNRMYQDFLKWVAEGNTLQEADSNEPPNE